MASTKVCLVKLKGMPITIVAGSHTFPIENGKLIHSESQQVGCKVNNKSSEYDDAYDLAAWALFHDTYDEIEDH